MIKKHDVNEMNLNIENVDFWHGHDESNKGGMRIYWSGNIGFGTLDIVKRKGNDGDDYESPEEEVILTAHTEYMDKNDDKEFTKKILSLFAEKLKVVD